VRRILHASLIVTERYSSKPERALLSRHDRLKPVFSQGFTTIYKLVTVWSNSGLLQEENVVARLAKDVTVVSQPVCTFPNGDFFYIELSRKHNRYNCVLKMARDGNADEAVIVVRSQGKTILEAEEECYRKAVERCPRFPRPPYSKRRARSERVVSRFLPDRSKEPVKG
jgi:hypothetical protein